MTNLNTLTLKAVLDGVKANTFTMAEVTKDVSAAVKQSEKINAFVSVNENVGTDSEQLTDSALMGVPIAVKDNISTKGMRTTASSTVLDTFIPQQDATVAAKIKAAGASIIGKTNLDAWAHGSSTETSQYGRTLNPRNTDHLPGGSSGGSAAAVAADLCIAAIGTETAGSIRQPAAWCGIVGLKPTYGRVSRSGVIAMASSTDSPGPMGKTVEDTAILLNHLAGHDQYDSTTSQEKVPDFTSFLGKSIKDLRVGLLYQNIEGMETVKPHIEAAAEVLTSLGAVVETTEALEDRKSVV